jgi:hypothetical protein
VVFMSRFPDSKLLQDTTPDIEFNLLASARLMLLTTPYGQGLSVQQSDADGKILDQIGEPYTVQQFCCKTFACRWACQSLTENRSDVSELWCAAAAMLFAAAHSRTHASFTHSATQSLSHSCTHSLAHSLAPSITHPPTHSLTHSITRSLAHSLTLSLARSLTHSLTRSLSRSLAHPPTADYCVNRQTPCVAANSCQNVTCVPRTGECTISNVPDGTTCSVNATVNGTCSASLCVAPCKHCWQDNMLCVTSSPSLFLNPYTCMHCFQSLRRT